MNIEPSPEVKPSLGAFLQKLMDEGIALVFAGREVPVADADAERVLRLTHGALGRTLVGDVPEFSLNASIWAAQMFYRLCQFTVCRDVSEEEVAKALAGPCPESRSPRVDWSVDLCLRYLPEVHRVASHLANGDPLVREIQRFGSDWPLSSVGLKDLNLKAVESFAEHPALLQLYVDRILAAEDVSRLTDWRVRDLARTTLGAHSELCSNVAARLSNVEEPCANNPS